MLLTYESLNLVVGVTTLLEFFDDGLAETQLAKFFSSRTDGMCHRLDKGIVSDLWDIRRAAVEPTEGRGRVADVTRPVSVDAIHSDVGTGGDALWRRASVRATDGCHTGL